MVTFTPWDPNLGIVRPHDELAGELRRRGHQVDTFSADDIIEKVESGAHFRQITEKALLDRGLDYDVIDAIQGSFVKPVEWGKEGPAVIVRSPGLYLHYDRFEALSASWRREEMWLKRFLKRLKRKVSDYLKDGNDPIVDSRDHLDSLIHSDRILVLNRDEKRTLEEELGLGEKTRYIPGLIPRENLKLLNEAGRERAAYKKEARIIHHVVALGNWGLRKGALDWGQIITDVWAVSPEVTFSFLGTMMPDRVVWADLGISRSDGRVSLIQRFEHDSLPELLREATVGALPSYIEGFGLAVLEMLGSGLPVIAYDVPGPREMLKKMAPPESYLVTPGDTKSFSNALLRLIGSNKEDYTNDSDMAKRVASAFVLEDWYDEVINVYEEAMESAKS